MPGTVIGLLYDSKFLNTAVKIEVYNLSYWSTIIFYIMPFYFLSYSNGKQTAEPQEKNIMIWTT